MAANDQIQYLATRCEFDPVAAERCYRPADLGLVLLGSYVRRCPWGVDVVALWGSPPPGARCAS
jgi:hypothetical protein